MTDDFENAHQMMPWRNAIECLVHANSPKVARLATVLRADGVLESGDFFRLVIDHMKILLVRREYATSDVVGLHETCSDRAN